MDNLYFGEIIKNRREELNISQDELCEGILDRTALSRIENGKAECRKYVAEVLLERLNLPMEFYYASYSKKGIEQLKIKNQIKDAIRMREYDTLAELLEKGLQFNDDSKLYQQFILRSKATYIIYVEKDLPKAREILLDALKIMHPFFDIDNISKPLFSEDILILNTFANTYSQEINYEKAINIFKILVDIVKSKSNDNIDSIRTLIMLEYNLSRVLGRADYYKECLAFSEEAIELSIRSGTMTYLGELFMNKAYALCSIHSRKEEGILALKDALTFNRLTNRHETVEIIKKDAKSLFGIDLSDF